MSTLPADIALTLPSDLPKELLCPPAFRTTLGVLVDLIANARERIILAAPFIQLTEAMCTGPLGAALMSALDRGVLLDVVGTSGSLGELGATSLATQRGQRHFRVSQPSPNVDDPRAMGSHAKLCLVDGVAAYVGSANLTEKGLSTHLEVGVLLRGEPARSLWQFISRLYDLQFFVTKGWAPWPAAGTR